jgi:hypothetical protein
VANKTLWLALETGIGRHQCVKFAWVKAHSGPLHNEIADTLATRGVNGYVCFSRKPFQNLSRNLSPPRRFSLPGESAAFNGTA